MHITTHDGRSVMYVECRLGDGHYSALLWEHQGKEIVLAISQPIVVKPTADPDPHPDPRHAILL